MTNPTLEHNVVYELIMSGLKPRAIITDNPFYVKKVNLAKYFVKKVIIIAKYLCNRQKFKNKFQPYFLAKKYSIPVYNSANVNTKDFELKIKNMQIDYVFTFGFRILKENIINAPRIGCINFHPAFLPNNRGATPTKWIILKNKNETGITFHYITKGIDEGEIIEQHKIPLSGYENTEILNRYLFNIGCILLVKLIYKIKNNIKITSISNVINSGSYERPFKKENSIISEENSYEEINKIIRASRDGYKHATYNYKDQNLEILNCLDSTENTIKSTLPFLDLNGNIFIKTSDNKQILLVIKSINRIDE